MLHEHLEAYGTDAGGHMLTGERGPIAADTYQRIWDKTRPAALTPEQRASPLARRPYTLRHPAVSTWLNEAVPATQVAEWAGSANHNLGRSTIPHDRHHS